MARTGFVWDRTFLGHATSTTQKERPDRVQGLDPAGFAKDVPGCVAIRVNRALGLPWIGRVHEREFVERVRTAHQEGIQYLDRGETVVLPDTYQVAEFATSAAVSLTEAVCTGKVDNGFAALRPPGHHAGPVSARGFCYFNHAAACARYAQQIHGAKRVLIVDWDVHPGDGTEAIFYDDQSVHVMSVHQRGLFAETCCSEDQIGRGEGEGATYNVPLEKHTGPVAYLKAFERALDTAAGRCRPDLVIISAGFDAHRGDPLGGLSLDEDTFAAMTRAVRHVAKQYASGRIVSLLEGGYAPAVIRRCVRSHVESLQAA